jgi:hypothetical protein
VWITPGFSSFEVGGPASSARSGWSLSGMGCLVPQQCVTRGNWSYLDFWVVTGDLRYPGYKTSTVATEPSIERVVGAVYLTRDRIGTHMLLQVLPWDLVVRLWLPTM